MDLPVRKPNRLKDYDYSQNGAYFITICVKDKKEIFWDVGACIARSNNHPKLSKYGNVIENAIKNIPLRYPMISVDKYVIMPNHIHLILIINNNYNGRAMHAPTISTVVNQMKGFVTKQIGFSIWQKLFYDHIIRNEQEYLKIWQYVDTNASKWREDCFYNKQIKL